jgi:hypothetical protein
MLLLETMTYLRSEIPIQVRVPVARSQMEHREITQTDMVSSNQGVVTEDTDVVMTDSTELSTTITTSRTNRVIAFPNSLHPPTSLVTNPFLPTTPSKSSNSLLSLPSSPLRSWSIGYNPHTPSNNLPLSCIPAILPTLRQGTTIGSPQPIPLT